MEGYKDINPNTGPENDSYKEHIDDVGKIENEESDEVFHISSQEQLDEIMANDPDLYYAIMDKMSKDEETKINEILNDKKRALEEEKAELKKMIEDLYKKDENDKYTDI